jgi:formate C-acetyltransferase
MAPTARNKLLRDETHIKSLGRVADVRSVKSGMRICLERSRAMTKVYKETEGEFTAIRRAKALAEYLDTMTLYTRPNELLVGCFASTEASVPIYPELYWRWLSKTIDRFPDYAAMVGNEEAKKEINEQFKYWENYSIQGRERDYVPSWIPWKVGELPSGAWTWQWEMCTPDFEKVMKVGLNGIIAEIDKRSDEVINDISIQTEKRMDMLDELRAMKISCEAVARWSKRYAKLLEDEKKKVTDAKRLKELDKMIEVCNRVPAEPARNLYEAVQCFIFINYIVNYIDVPQVGNGIRFDKVLYPYYEKDLKDGVMTRDGAKELVEAVWVKMQEGGYVQPPAWVNNGGGGLGWQTMTLSGVDDFGLDVTNEMTYIALEVTGELQTIAPQIAVRMHDNTPDELLNAVFKCVRTGCSQPAMFNDKVNIPRLMGLGATVEDARGYSINNCMQPVIPGKNIHYRAGHGGSVILPMCLNMAMDEGKVMGIPFGPQTPPLSEMKSMDDIWKAFCEQVKYGIMVLAQLSNLGDTLQKKYVPRPFLSAVLDGNIQKGCDMRDWEYLGLRHFLIFGCNNTADGFAAIKKLVFEKKKITLEYFREAINNNFSGEYEKVRQMIEQEVPRFGNDNDYVDQFAKDIMVYVQHECNRNLDIYGNPHLIDGTTASGPINAGMLLPTTYDGRLSNEPFHDGTISPVQGRDLSGPTATIRSVAKVDPLKTGNMLLNQKFMPVFFDPENYELMRGYLKTVRDMGLHHVQFNCVSKETLLDAKKVPEKYKSLIVRVAGYSAYYVDLDNKIQDEIITRTEQCFRC